ncbi:hypothetical protein IAR50_004315 [Cryptococcus sp. DSM 104548]
MTQPDLSSLPTLPHDIVLIILEHIESIASPSTLATVARVSRSLHRRFTPLLYKSPTLTQHNCSRFFSGLSSADVIDEDEKEEWWKGEAADKKSAVARRLAMLGYVRKVEFADLAAVKACHSAIEAFLAHGLQSPPKSWYIPDLDDSPSKHLLFHGRFPPIVHLSANLLGSLRTSESPINTQKAWIKLVSRMMHPWGALSLQQPSGPTMPYVGRCLEPICRVVRPYMVVLDDVKDLRLANMLSSKQGGVLPSASVMIWMTRRVK